MDKSTVEKVRCEGETRALMNLITNRIIANDLFL